MENVDQAAALAAASETTEKNPMFALFDAPHFEPIENAQTYTNRDGSRTRTLARVLIPVKGLNATIPGVIKIRWVPGQRSKPAGVFTFASGAFKPLDESANALVQDYRRHIARLYAKQQNGPLVIGRNAAGVDLDVELPDEDDDE